MANYVADFETTTTEPTRVWLWSCVNIARETDIHVGYDIESFIEFTRTRNATYYFHNLKFDGKFILDYALRTLGFTQAEQRVSNANGRKYTLWKENTFATVISDLDVFYEITLFYKQKTETSQLKARFRDSMKKFGANVSVAKIAKGYDVGGITKLDIDYEGDRQKGYVPTEQEIAYVKNDVLIVARALKYLFDRGLRKMTIGADAMKYYKERMPDFSTIFPVVDNAVDSFIRLAYKGGYTMVNKSIAGNIMENGVSHDVNSMYPYCMTLPLPYGMPIAYEGQHPDNPEYPLYIQRVRCQAFYVKDGYLPTIQIKKSRYYIATEYVESSCPLDDTTELVLTSVDLQLFLDHYHVVGLEYVDGFMFKASSDMFTDYIHYWYGEKATSTGSKRQLCKLMLNNLYGKFAQATTRASKTPYIGEDGILHLRLNKEEQVDPVYTAMPAFVCSYARDKLIRAAQKMGGSRADSGFWYCDTDSIHGKDMPNIGEILDVDQTRLGAWGFEYRFSKAKYLRAKAYIEYTEDEKTVIKCAAMPDSMKYDEEGKPLFTVESFRHGYEGTRLQAKTVEGGVILQEKKFTIKGMDE